MLGSDHWGLCKKKLELSKLSLIFGPSAALTSTLKDSNLKFCVKMKGHFSDIEETSAYSCGYSVIHSERDNRATVAGEARMCGD